jgi:ABC-type branched-subunit amino acid transport system substrate-binding protein
VVNLPDTPGIAKTQKVKLGWLFPYSGIFRQLRTDLERGFALGWGDGNNQAVLIPYPAFIQTGSLKDTEDALKKMLLYDEVDLVVGVISTKVALHLLPLLARQQTALLFLNLGADIPHSDLSSPYLLYNSLHLWASEWVMGKWAQQKFGGDPSINMSAYEGGYGLFEAFKAGTAAGGADTVTLNIVRNFSPVPDTSSLIQSLRTQQPSYAHALLSGKEGEQFLRLFREQGLSNIPLTANPFMTENSLMGDLPEGPPIYNAITWSQNLDNPINRRFVEEYRSRYDEYPNAFSLLAYEAGLAAAAAMQYISGKIQRDSLARALEEVRVPGPRGEINLSTRPLQTNLPVFIRQSVIRSGANQPKNEIIAQGIDRNDPLLSFGQNYFTGWQNPYLCV